MVRFHHGSFSRKQIGYGGLKSPLYLNCGNQLATSTENLTKQRILNAIRELAAGNNGVAPGTRAFERETGIKESDWYPNIWLRWGEAVTEAGFSGNEFKLRIPDDTLIEKYIGLLRELGRLPLQGE